MTSASAMSTLSFVLLLMSLVFLPYSFKFLLSILDLFLHLLQCVRLTKNVPIL